ncbi:MULTISPECIES: hypothetical protein [unclassified Streptomyces]|uniref:hypothetical protein n=1 Tax=unclassified Streptomyces TaxID=2593676 RepID=UPI001F0B8EC3|nr:MULTISPECIES: hypothetical protein [unclassified Streptomyces]
MQPPAGAAQRHRARGAGEGVDQGPVRQAEQSPGRLGGQAGVERVVRRVAPGLGAEAVPQRRPVPGIGEPVTGDGRRGGCGAHGLQFGPADDAAPAQLVGAVRTAGHVRQLGGSGPGRAPPGQGRGADVQHGHPAGGAAPPAGLPQHRPVADPQGEVPGGGEAGRVRAERPHGHGDGGGAQVQGGLTGEVGGGRGGDPDVERAGEQPAVGRPQHLAPAE